MIDITLQISGKATRQFHFRDTDMVGIGRSAGNALCIADKRVSGLHGQIACSQGEYIYRDLRSTNGSMLLRGEERTVVDGDETPEVTLATGDVLLLGDVEDPVVLHVALSADVDDVLPAEGTLVASRAMDGADALSHLLLSREAESAGSQLLNLLRTVGETTEASVVFQHVGEFILSSVSGSRSVVYVATGTDEQSFSLSVGDNEPQPIQADSVPYPRGLVQHALVSGEAILSADDASVDTEKSLARFDATTAIAAPVGKGKDATGVLVAIGDGRFTADALETVAALSHQVGHAFKTARLVRRLRGVERRLRDENRYLRQQVDQDETFPEIIGQSPAIKEVFDKMRVVMGTDVTVMITGETGTGKELVARAIHTKGPRAERLFAPVNCAALNENLLESELFGHVKGAFTGAIDNKKGLFQVADRGTLFLDEIGELSQKLQAKLLRVLQEGEVLPVGAIRPVSVDVRIVAATHRNLKEEVKANTFREDLFYRLNVFTIPLPPLRERRDDIPLLAQFLLEKYSAKFGKNVTGFTEAAVTRLKTYAFPGNIRELENEVQRAILLSPDDSPIDTAQLRDEVRGSDLSMALSETNVGSLKETMEKLEIQVLRRALDAHGWNRSQTARTLCLSRQALMAKLSKYKLTPDE